tara:strand:- start:4088 stop:4531 length:444 start_codon:yes stop_codon:yes gene_type:complete
MSYIVGIAEEQDFLCYYCDHPMHKHQHVEGQPTPRDAITKDHYIARAWGGLTHPSNMVAACCQCNNLRGDIEAEAFKNLMWKWFKRNPYLWIRWHNVANEELYELKLQCIRVYERQLRGKAQRYIEFAYHHFDFTFRERRRLALTYA